MPDREIVRMFLERLDDAVAETQSRYGKLIRSVASNFLNSPEDAEECVNDVYLALWNRIPPEEPEDLAAYACGIARNLAVKRYRTASADKRNSRYDLALDELAECLGGGTDPSQELDASETAARVNRFLGTLENGDRNLFLLRYWYGYTAGETAEHAGRSAHYVSVRLSRIRRRLKEYLEREEVTP